jgi:uncharacterized protein YbbC (DUF1343 family)/CubicO group peptidase (beta-lactamase class C family)
VLALLLGCSRPQQEPTRTASPPDTARATPTRAAPIGAGATSAEGESPEPSFATPTRTHPLAAGFDGSEIDALLAKAIADVKLPGAVVVVGKRDGVLLQRAYGKRALVPRPEPMTLDTIFDLASLTKPVATATAIMALREHHRLDLDARASRYLPELARKSTAKITIRQLLLHTSGLPHVNPLREYDSGPELALKNALAVEPTHPPGQFEYSDVGYIWLGELVGRFSHQSLQAQSGELFWSLGMSHTSFNPDAKLRNRIAPTEVTDERGAPGLLIRGVVHDPRAYRLGGIAGNAGLFSTADDLTRYAQMLLALGRLPGTSKYNHDTPRPLSYESVLELTRPQPAGDSVRTPGFDVRSRFSRLRGTLLSERAYGHGGFTGTSLFIDPKQDLFVLFLSNRVHPDGKGDVIGLTGAVTDAAVRALRRTDPCLEPPSEVLPGIDVLAQEGFEPLFGKRVALLTHLPASSRFGRPTLELFTDAKAFELAAIFSPEHGLEARHEGVVGNRSVAGNVPVYSLFGPTRRPTRAMLAGVDVVVVDLVDVGTRFFTYMSTLHELLRAAAKSRVQVMILDRPNPLGGLAVEGPLLDPERRSFVNHHALPIRHGLTAGELALLLRADDALDVKIDVVRASGWRRELMHADTELTWEPPSPNLRSTHAALLYPAVGLLESTNLSVGRGTDAPFEQLGAPFVDAQALLAAVRRQSLPGVKLEAADFTPKQGPHAGQLCHGLRLAVSDSRAFAPVRTGLAIAKALRELHPADWKAEDLIKLLGNGKAQRALLEGRDLDAIEATWSADLARFRQRREAFLLYPACDAEK